MSLPNMNVSSTEVFLSIPFDKHRSYIEVIASGGDIKVTIHTGRVQGKSFTIRDGETWYPRYAPMNKIDFEDSGNGTMLISGTEEIKYIAPLDFASSDFDPQDFSMEII